MQNNHINRVESKLLDPENSNLNLLDKNRQFYLSNGKSKNFEN